MRDCCNRVPPHGDRGRGWERGARPVPETAIFAGGCFWSSESAFEKVYGVIEVVSGYTGGTTKNPNYGNYAREVTWRPCGYLRREPRELRGAPGRFWRSVDPADAGGQFYDRGPNYRPVIYWKSDRSGERRRGVEGGAGPIGQVHEAHRGSRRKRPSTPAEEYHQDYAKKNPVAVRVQ